MPLFEPMGNRLGPPVSFDSPAYKPDKKREPKAKPKAKKKRKK